MQKSFSRRASIISVLVGLIFIFSILNHRQTEAAGISSRYSMPRIVFGSAFACVGLSVLVAAAAKYRAMTTADFTQTVVVGGVPTAVGAAILLNSKKRTEKNEKGSENSTPSLPEDPKLPSDPTDPSFPNDPTPPSGH